MQGDLRGLHLEREVHPVNKIAKRAYAVIAQADGVHLDGSMGQGNLKIFDAHILRVAHHLQAEFFQLEAGVGFGHAQAFDGCVDAVAPDGFQGDARNDVVQRDVVGVEFPRGFLFGKHIVGQGPPPDEQGVDAQIQVGIGGFFFFRLEGVHDELEIGGILRRLFIQPDSKAEQLDVADGNLSFQQGQEVEFGRQAGHPQHLFPGQVFHIQVVDDDAVEESHVDLPYAQFAPQHGA